MDTKMSVQNLTPKQDRFVEEYLVTGNASEAYRRAYDCSRMLPATVNNNAGKLLRENNAIKARIAERREAASNTANLDRAGVINLITEIATADASQLMRLEVRNCRHCWGVRHAFQWMHADEYAYNVAQVSDQNARAQARYQADLARGVRREAPAEAELPTDEGGYGFDVSATPNPACPKCLGDGIETPRFVDTRKLKGAAKRLFAGIERTKDGFKMHTRDQKHALELLAKIHKVVPDEKQVAVNMQVNNAPGGTVQTAVVMPADPLAAATAYQELMKGNV